ncbi:MULTISPECIES: cellulase family glycosylhydrolase [unclassified Actinopolyspora]|uniref:cellulase family glycosylhydrolase n=1 Tax=unclassified Actinopolyspora TaxID=2639451 RepID=UPI0013F5D495|nr:MULTISPECIES: cellulase family glycosylhydrolase [unclassified Actinopolyspora]NHD16089.1 cellulase family glycosylhydrolase [Actinopolyspora sp. BKK2]NHE74697.1 cellulase family glycosylhydrolase [Actinopolyspora sp. BKK1]
MRRGFAMVDSAGSPVNWLGVNFWSREGGPRMWTRYNSEVVRSELRTLREHGLNVTRSFFFWPDFMPESDRIDENCVANYADFLRAHEEIGMSTIPTFLVGHMSGQNFDPPWRAGRDLYSDVWMVERQAWFVERMTRRFADSPAVAGWLISNEMPIYGEAAGREVVSSWAKLMVQAVRAGGGHQPVSIGDGAWGVEVTGADNGFSVRELGELTDFLGPHVYRMEDDQIRQHYAAAFICEMVSTFGHPVVLEEFGLSSDFASDEHAAHYYRQALHNTLLAGTTGWIAWNNTDFDNLVEQDPYRHHPFELHFGLTEVDGTPKPQLEEMADFARTLSTIDVANCSREDAQAALVVPEHMEGDVPITDEQDNKFPFAVLRQSYVSAKLADLPVGLTRERDGVSEECSLYLLPSTKQLTAPSCYQLERLARDGAVVYVSYCHGISEFQRGPWFAHLNEMFGIEHQLRYGLVDRIEHDRVEMTFTSDFGDLPAGTTLPFAVAGNEHSRSYLPVRPTDAEVVAVDQDGRPALLRRKVGSGWVVLCTYPLEHMATLVPGVNPDATVQLYDALAVTAGLSRSVLVDNPLVSADVLRHGDGRRFAFVVSHSDHAAKVEPQVPAGRLVEPDSGTAVESMELEPHGVRMLLLDD